MKPRSKRTRSSTRPATHTAAEAKQRVSLTYPPELLQEPLIYWVGQKFKVITNIRSAAITDETGMATLELQGAPHEIDGALSWLRSRGVKVERFDKMMIE